MERTTGLRSAPLRRFAKRILTLVALGIAALSASGGCTVEIDPSDGIAGGPAESTGAEEAALTTCTSECGKLPMYTIASSSNITGPPTSTHICFPTAYHATPTQYDPHLLVEQSNGSWVAKGHGTMTCAPTCCFNSNGGSADVRWLSENFWVAQHANRLVGGLIAEQPMWLGDAMEILSGVYHFGSPGMSPNDKARTLWYSPTTASKLRVEVWGGWDAPSDVGATGYSFFVGKPGTGHQVRRKDYTVTNAANRVYMIGNSSGICTLNYLAGLSDALGADVGQWSSGNWVLRGPTGTRARCFYYDQSQ
jgi:hypothetical protein